MRSTIALWVVVFILAGLAVAAIATGALNTFIREVGELVTAAVTGIIGLVSVVLTQTFARSREQAQLHEQREHELDTAHNQRVEEKLRTQVEERRRNYAATLGAIGEVIRNEKPGDEFSRIHLETWVWGSREVIEAAQAFLEATANGDKLRNRTELARLVNAMRSDVGLETAPDLKLDWIYPPRGSL